MATKRTSIDEYGKTKLAIERLVKNSGIDYIIIRPSVIYERSNLSLIGKSLKSIPFVIPIIGNGKYMLSPVHADDVTEAIKRAVSSKNSINKDYDIAGPEAISFNEIIKICKKEFNIKKINVHIPGIVGRDLRRLLQI